MSKSTPNLIPPAEALKIWENLLPGAPADGERLNERSRRGTGPPSTIYKGPGTPHAGRTMYDAAAVRAWCLKQQPEPVSHVLGALSGEWPVRVEDPVPGCAGEFRLVSARAAMVVVDGLPELRVRRLEGGGSCP